MNTEVNSSKQLLYLCPMGLEISGEYLEYRIMTPITGIIVKHQL